MRRSTINLSLFNGTKKVYTVRRLRGKVVSTIFVVQVHDGQKQTKNNFSPFHGVALSSSLLKLGIVIEEVSTILRSKTFWDPMFSWLKIWRNYPTLNANNSGIP